MYEERLATEFRDGQFKRLASGIYVAPIDALIWKGLHISPFQKRGVLSVSPALAFYCPAAYSVIRATFRSMGNRGFEQAARSQKMGVPIIVEPLEAVVRRELAIGRSAMSYDVRWQDELQSSIELLYEDFLSTCDFVFSRVKDLSELLGQVVAHQGNRNPSAAINAMALCVVQDRSVSAEKLQSCVELFPSPITFRFLEALIAHLRNENTPASPVLAKSPER
jgi:hypothetical protein